MTSLHRIRRRPESEAQPIKRRVIDWAFARTGARSFADLGGLWAVNGAYTFHALEHHQVERGCLVDEAYWSDAATRSARRHPQLELVQGNFGDPAIRDRVGEVDAVFLFDVLLHQVGPDWDEILAMYAESARCLCIVNPQWTAGPETVRLVDLGREEFIASVPAQSNHDELFDRLDEIHPDHGRPHRDVHEIWQWGIVDEDLVGRLADLGFALAYYENLGPWQGLERFENHGFVFLRDPA